MLSKSWPGRLFSNSTSEDVHKVGPMTLISQKWGIGTTKCDSTKSSGCPVDHGKSASKPSVNDSGCPVKKSDETDKVGSISECPVSAQHHISKDSPLVYNAKANDLEFNQQPQPGQKIKLDTVRDESSIPKSDFTPTHQKVEDKNWVYPSEQQYYNAMKRKGYDPAEKDVPTILKIHNMVNEKGWNQVLEWERLRGNNHPKLKRFMGRPTDTSPKAYIMQYIWGYEPPFDRHDWIIERENKEEVRYVIDFYKGNNFKKGGSPLAIYLDVRPAMDSLPAIMDRVSHFLRMTFAPHSLPRSSILGAGKPEYQGLTDSKAKK